MMRLAIIPARKGSKGLPGKNMRLLCGYPLIWWTIDAAKRSRYISNIVVTSDDDDVLKLASEMGVIPMPRPDYLASDTATTIDVILHVLDKYGQKTGKRPIDIMLLQCTSPLRHSRHIDEAIELFDSQVEQADTLISVREKNHPIEWLRVISESGYLENYISHKDENLRRQDTRKIYEPNGAIYIARTNYIEKYKTFQSKRTIPYIMPVEESVDIDTITDFEFAEFLLNIRLRN